MTIKTIAIYLDIENINVNLGIQNLLDDIALKFSGEDAETKINFAFKKAVGNEQALRKYMNQLKELNFEIQIAPNVTGKKNRSDLIISIDAFEKLYLSNPSIDLFVFLTSDADYSIIMDKLRRYNKEVWLVATEKDAQREIFKSSADSILSMNEYELIDEKKQQEIKLNDFREYFGVRSKANIRAINAMLKVFKSFDVDKLYKKGTTNNLFRKIEKTLDLERTKFKKFDGLYRYLQMKKIMKFHQNAKGDDFISISNKAIINKYVQ